MTAGKKLTMYQLKLKAALKARNGSEAKVYSMTTDEKIQFIAGFYGLDNQLNKLAEECAEFSAIRIKDVFFTSSAGFAGAEAKETKRKMISELSDVLILAKEVECLLESDPEMKKKVKFVMSMKLRRQMLRIEEEQSHVKK